MKYLIAGLGNIGSEYQNTRHNAGFLILDALAGASNVVFKSGRYASFAEISVKGRKLVMIKPSTYMNLSGKAVNYWMQTEKIESSNLLVVVDDLALPFGTVRIKPGGSDAGHNGLKSINETLGHNNYARLRFGIGSDFSKGGQVDYVLGEWTSEEKKMLPERINISVEAVKSFSLQGLQLTMTNFNNK